MITYQILFTVEQLFVLDKALQNLVWKDANPIINHINNEIAKQQTTDLDGQDAGLC